MISHCQYHSQLQRFVNSQLAVVAICALSVSLLEMGRSSADAEVWPKNLAECSARFGSATCDYSAEVQPNFGKHSASFVASHLQRFALAAGVN